MKFETMNLDICTYALHRPQTLFLSNEVDLKSLIWAQVLVLLTYY